MKNRTIDKLRNGATQSVSARGAKSGPDDGARPRGLQAKSDDTAQAQQYLCGDVDIRIDRDGTWFYHGSPIGRKALVKLFASVLKRDEHGDYWLMTPVEQARITVDDAPFLAVSLDRVDGPSGPRLHFTTNLDAQVVAGPDHPIRVEHDAESGAPRPYITICDGLEALITRSVFYQLVELAEEDPRTKTMFVNSDGMRFVLGTTASTGECGNC